MDVFTATVLRCPERTALDAPDRSLTYAGLARAAERVADRLRAAGAGPGERVGVRVSSGTSELYVAVLGVLHAGAAYVPADADDPPERAREMWRRADVCAVVHDGLAIETLRPGAAADRELGVDDDAWIIFTSGSTGRPKPVAVTHRAAAAFVDAEAALFAIDIEDRVLAGLSVSFDASCEEMWLAWRHGAALVPATRARVRAGAELGPWLADCGVTVVSTVPTLAAMWDEHSLTDVRLLILGGEACPQALAWRLAAEREVWNTYGPTEATVVTTAARLSPGEPVTLGWPLRGWEVAVLDADGEPVALGAEGELVIAGVGLGRYLDGELDTQRYAPVPALGWERAYRTGDMVRETIHGLQFLGRRDDQVKIAGRRIELGEVDAALIDVPGVRAAATAVRETAAANTVLVAYVVGAATPDAVRDGIAGRLPAGLSPMIVPLDALPQTPAGKVDRAALPWPPPRVPAGEGLSGTAGEGLSGTAGEGLSGTAGEGLSGTTAEGLSGTAAWLAERWREQLGPIALREDSDFFALGGTSLAVAKLVSALRARFPAVAVADVYRDRRLGALAERLDAGAAAGAGPLSEATAPARHRRWSLLQLAGVFVVRLAMAPPWLLGLLALGRLEPGRIGPQVGWGWLIAGWIVFASVPGHAALLVLARRLLLRDLTPGRYRRRSRLTFKLWLLERLTAAWRLQGLEGTPWAARYARLCGHRVGRGTRLFTLPPVASLVMIGDAVTVEAEVDIEGWWIDGEELVVGTPRVGDGVRLGTHSVLMPGADVGPGAEVEPGAVVTGAVPAGRRWAGSPGRDAGVAGAEWPSRPAQTTARRRRWRAMFALGMLAKNVIPLAAAAPAAAIIALLAPAHATVTGLAAEAILAAPLIVLGFLVAYALLTAGAVRAVAGLIRPGWHPEDGATRWALWLTDALLGAANGVLFPVYLSVYTRAWLRLVGIDVGRRAEVSVTAGLNRLVRFGAASFAADAVVFATARSRGGWLHVGAIEIGEGAFLGNGSIIRDGTRVGAGALVGVLTEAPAEVPAGTSWFGSPPLALPQRPEEIDRARTLAPPRRLIVARGATELVRIVLPASLSVVLGSLMIACVESVGAAGGLVAMAAATPVAFVAAGACAVAMTVALKWVVIGRYRPGEHPLWSFFVWRDEIMNSCQEQLAGTWLMGSATATPLIRTYLRLMGATVGPDVWCETMTITEFDMVTLRPGAVVNRHALVETHLFHDRMLRIGPAALGAGATLGPISAVLPDTSVGDGSTVGARSVVMRGERLPERTRWHGAPVVAMAG